MLKAVGLVITCAADSGVGMSGGSRSAATPGASLLLNDTSSSVPGPSLSQPAALRPAFGSAGARRPILVFVRQLSHRGEGILRLCL